MTTSLRRIWLFVIPVLAVAGLLYINPAGAQSNDQGTIAKQLLGPDETDRHTALAAAQRLGAKMDPTLRTALFTALEREGKRHAERYRATKRGEALGDMEDAEFIGALTRAVVPLRDARAIPALVDALGTSALVTNALADFGEPAAPAVLAVVTSTESMPDAIDHGLITLRFMVEGSLGRLSPGLLAQIRAAASQRLTGQQPFVSTIWRAIDLAMALKDPDLTKIVQSIADSPFEVRSRGVTEPDLVERTQKWASDRLAGVPALPTRLVLPRYAQRHE